MTPRVRDATITLSSASLSGLLGGLWFLLLPPLLALLCTTVTSITLAVNGVLLRDRCDERDQTREEDDRGLGA